MLRAPAVFCVSLLGACHAVLPLGEPSRDGPPNGSRDLRWAEGTGQDSRPLDQLVEGAPDSAPQILLFDDFEDGVIDDKIWSPWHDTNVAPPLESGGRLALELAGDADCAIGATSCYSGLRSVSLDLTGATMQVEAVQVDTAGNSGDSGFFLYGDVTEGFYGIYHHETKLFFGYKTGEPGAWTEQAADYDPELHRHWRMTHRPAQDVIDFSSSSDGKSWQPLWSIPVQPDTAMKSSYLELNAGLYGKVAAPGTAIFDNVLVQRP